MNSRLDKLPKWKGYPIPFFASIRTDGVPDFKIISEDNRMACAKQELCWICGEKLEYWIFFIGGPRSVKAKMFVDGPMHRACAQEAMDVCPFLLGTMDYSEHFDTSKFDKKIEFTTGDKRAETQNPPEEIGVVRCRGFRVAIVRDPRLKSGTTWFFAVPSIQEITWRKR